MEKGTAENKEYLKKVGERIANIRKEKNITRTQLGYLCDIERPNIARIEGGGNNLTLITLRKIAAALEIEVIDLLRNIS